MALNEVLPLLLFLCKCVMCDSDLDTEPFLCPILLKDGFLVSRILWTLSIFYHALDYFYRERLKEKLAPF